MDQMEESASQAENSEDRSTLFRFLAMTYDETVALRHKDPAGFTPFFQAAHALYTRDSESLDEANWSDEDRASVYKEGNCLRYIFWYHTTYVLEQIERREMDRAQVADLLRAMQHIRIDLVPTILNIFDANNTALSPLIEDLLRFEVLLAEKYFEMRADSGASHSNDNYMTTVEDYGTSLEFMKEEYLLKD
ncbi:hypothetical protein PMAYCL1PPCAC_14796 [Pristionchus mayeri]|uniref:Uncharacterized protein n=1 Tax=Pristionchus mayeri TaxID=1317129 RepID=A0AAN5CHN6_9BILA|nr:hypothetical protein PMAYCL1PPCAC_14796 [Pristionchus mayeri]